jgi:S1-C subfamily serine protease
MKTLGINLKNYWIGLTAAALGLAGAAEARADADLYERTLRSTAWVVSPIGKDKVSFGSGALVDVKRRLVVTNFHVVEKREQAVVFFPRFQAGQLVSDPGAYIKNSDKLAVAGKVLKTDPTRDLAVIELRSLPAGVRALPLARQAPRPGQAVHAIGNSGISDGALWRYSKGEVRQVYQKKGKTKNDTGLEFEINARVLESQIPSNKGDSGGPIVNERGELVAITQGANEKEQLIAFGIEVSEVRAVLGLPVAAARPEAVARRNAEEALPEDAGARTPVVADDLPPAEGVARAPAEEVKAPAGREAAPVREPAVRTAEEPRAPAGKAVAAEPGRYRYYYPPRYVRPSGYGCGSSYRGCH